MSRLGEHRKKPRSRGNAAIEFALSFGLLWAILSGVFQFGYAMFVYNSLAGAVAEGAHYAARVDFDEPGHTFVTAVKNMVVYGSPTAGTTPLAPGLAASQVNVAWTADAKGYPETMTVGITGYRCDTPFRTFVFEGKPRATVRFLGVYKTP